MDTHKQSKDETLIHVPEYASNDDLLPAHHVLRGEFGTMPGPQKKQDPLSYHQIVEAMRYLGYHTHDAAGEMFPEVHTAACELRKGLVCENVMLPTLIAKAIDKAKKDIQAREATS